MIETSRTQQPQPATASEELLGEAASSLSVELRRISAEIQSIDSGFQAQMAQALAETREAIESEYNARLESALATLRQQLETENSAELSRQLAAERHNHSGRFAGIRAEIDRVTVNIEAVATEIALMIDDPAAELSHIMRKNAEQAELKAYLAGLHYCLGQ